MKTEAIWSQLRAGLLAFVRGQVPDEHAAEDVLQETFVRVHDALTGGARPERVGAWVFRIARNVLIDRRRAERGADELDPARAEAPGADDENLNAEVRGWLPGMLAELPPELAEALRLSELEGLPQTELAARLGISHSGARSRVQRGRARLREALLSCCHLDFDRHGNVVDYRRRGACRGCQ